MPAHESRVGRRARRIVLALGILALVPASASTLAAQERELATTAPVIDTIIVNRSNVFTEEEAESSGVFRVMNAIHVTTQEWLILDYLQFEVGEPYDPAEIAESERKLRAKRLFRELSIDSVRLEDGRLAVRVDAQDGWSLKPKFSLSIASNGDWTGAFGVNEINLLGTGNQVYLAYVKEIDRENRPAIQLRRAVGREERKLDSGRSVPQFREHEEPRVGWILG
jgi:hypothetical protein